jgi:hypothetical protein
MVDIFSRERDRSERSASRLEAAWDGWGVRVAMVRDAVAIVEKKDLRDDEDSACRAVDLDDDCDEMVNAEESGDVMLVTARIAAMHEVNWRREIMMALRLTDAIKVVY